MTEINRICGSRPLPSPYSHLRCVVPAPPSRKAVKLTDVRHALITAHAAIARAPTDLKPEAVQFEAKASCSIEGIDDEETVGNCLQAIEASCHMAPIGNFENVRQLHSVLMCNEPAIAGRIRDGIVWIGGFSLEAAGFIPPTPTYIDQCLTDHFGYLDAAANELALVQDVVTRLAISHAHFEAIHPFRDGNGRIGRILMVRFLFDLTGVWLPLSVGIARDTRGYFDGLACAQRRGDHSLLVRVLAKAIEQSTG